MARFGHRSLGPVASVIALVGVMVLVAVPPSAATTCLVSNARTDAEFRTLQDAVDASRSGDALLVSGRCVGKTEISDQALTLKGITSANRPTPTLDGNGKSTVLQLTNADVVIVNLSIANGRGRSAGGIWAYQGDLTLKGSSSVVRSVSLNAGGITLSRGTLLMSGSSSVAGNTGRDGPGGIQIGFGSLIMKNSASVIGNVSSEGSGGGVSIEGRKMIMSGSASVSGNTAARDAGGIWVSKADLTLKGSASVTGNNAGSVAGGIATSDRLTLDDSASVTGNTALGPHGGILSGGSVFVCSDLVRISPNTPDDPPATLPCP